MEYEHNETVAGPVVWVGLAQHFLPWLCPSHQHLWHFALHCTPCSSNSMISIPCGRCICVMDKHGKIKETLGRSDYSQLLESMPGTC